MLKVKFVKMTGAGNDFIVIDNRVNQSLSLNVENIKNLCDRKYGIGADGLITISDSDKYDFTMQYFNSDGSTGSLCGNGARCAIKYVMDSERIKGLNIEFLSNDAEYSGSVIPVGQYRLNLNSPVDLKLDEEIEAFSYKIKYDFINTGSPHVVIDIDSLMNIKMSDEINFSDLNDFPVYKLGKEIRHNKNFYPQGANVNFLKFRDDKIFIRTYERGVEDETLACGTGSVAAAIIGSINHKISPPVQLVTRGGEKLIVDFKIDNDKYNDVSLTGPAVTVFSGEITINNFD